MNFCPCCGGSITLRTPAGDHLPRHVCDACGEVHYQNPKVVVGAIPLLGDKILLARRAIEPRHGFWTLPAGFMENGETTGAAAIRETREEVCADIELDRLFSLINIPHISQIHIFYLARMRTPEFAPGAESIEVRLFSESEIPWEELAFRSTTRTLMHYFSDRSEGVLRLHTEDLEAVGKA